MKNIAKFLLELGMLKKVKRSGWWMAGIKDPESVAEHSWRAAAIGYVLAKLEKADADKVVKMCVFHELAESRISDTHKVGRRYIKEELEKKVAEEQLKYLPYEIGKELLELFLEAEARKSKEAVIAKDADYLEGAVQSKEYIDAGNTHAREWFANYKKALKTESAKKIAEAVGKSEPWWAGLKKLD